MRLPRTLQIGDNVLWSDGTVLGSCKECRADAIQYNDNGDLLCDEHLVEYYDEDGFDQQRCPDCGGRLASCVRFGCDD